MSPSAESKEPGKVAFWQVIHDCLTQVHRLPEWQAAKRILKMRAGVDQVVDGRRDAKFYQADPIEVAHALAKDPWTPGNRRELANRIVARHTFRPHSAGLALHSPVHVPTGVFFSRLQAALPCPQL